MLLSTSMANYIRHYSAEKSIDIIADAGFTGIDYSFNIPSAFNENSTIEEFKRIKEYANSKGVVFNQAHAPFPSSSVSEVETEERFMQIVKAMKFASVLGVKIIVVHPVQHLTYADEGVPEKLFEMNMEFYNNLKPYCEEYNIKIGVENMWQSRSFVGGQTIIHSTCSRPDEFVKYIDTLNNEWFVACLDLGHAMLVNEAPEKFIKALGKDRLKALHVHDVDGRNDLHTIPYYGGAGDWDKIAKALKEIEYDGDFTYEAGAFLNAIPNELYPAATRYMFEVGNSIIKKII